MDTDREREREKGVEQLTRDFRESKSESEGERRKKGDLVFLKKQRLPTPNVSTPQSSSSTGWPGRKCL